MKYKNILILGASGFVGSHLVQHLVQNYPDMNIHIVLKSKPNMFTSMLGQEGVLNRVNIIFGDITDYKLVETVVAEYEINYIVDLAALSIVRTCNEAPLVAFYNNVYSVAVLAEISRQYKSVKQTIVSTCYDEETKALTKDGLKRYDEVRVGDEILSINPDTKEYEYTKVKNIIVEPYNGKMIKFKSATMDLLVTPNHKMLINNKHNCKFVDAKEFLIRSASKLAYGIWKGIDYLDFDLEMPESGNKLNRPIDLESLFYLTGIFIGDGCIQQQQKETKTGLNRKDYLEKSKDNKTGKFIKMEKQGTSTTHSNVVHLYIPENDSCRPRVIKAIESLGLSWGSWLHGGEGALYVNSAELVKLFRECGSGALNKKIPEWAKKANTNLLEKLLEGIQDSDGGKKSKIIATSSEKLIQDCIELGYKLGRPVSVAKRKSYTNFIKGREIHAKQGYFVNVRKTQGYIQRKQVSEIDYNGIVWCLTLEKNKNFIVERNGKTVISGNSDKAYGQSPSLPYKEDNTPLFGMRPYECTKTLGDLWCQMYHKNYGTPVTVFRSANIYGPADPNMSRLIPQVCTSVAQNKNPWLYGGVNSYIREFVYIQDVIDFIINLMVKCDENPELAKQCYNLGSGNVFEVEDVVNMIISLSGKDVEIEIKEKELDFYEIPEQYLSLNKSFQLLGWRAEYVGNKFMDSLVETYNYYYELIAER